MMPVEEARHIWSYRHTRLFDKIIYYHVGQERIGPSDEQRSLCVHRRLVDPELG
jgi:hypothetical protein